MQQQHHQAADKQASKQASKQAAVLISKQDRIEVTLVSASYTGFCAALNDRREDGKCMSEFVDLAVLAEDFVSRVFDKVSLRKRTCTFVWDEGRDKKELLWNVSPTIRSM